MKSKILYILYILFFFLFLAIPGLQWKFNIFKEPPLGGYISEPKTPSFAVDSLWNGMTQEVSENFMKRKYGFRAWFVRIYNQWQFSFYNRLGVSTIVSGIDNYMFGRGYIETHYGVDFIGKDSIDKKINKLRCFNNLLQRNGKQMLMVIASSKGTFYEEKIPDSFKKNTIITNYEYYKNMLTQFKLPLIDFNSYGLEIKQSALYSLYPKYGIHWSYYFGYLAVDSLLHYVEDATNKDLPDLILDSLEVKTGYSGDADILAGLNLLFPMDPGLFAYPKYHYNKENKDSLKVLVVGDSFYYALGNMRFLQDAFNDSEFWFYNNGGSARKPMDNKSELNVFFEKVLGFDYVIFIVNEANLKGFAWNFLEDINKASQLRSEI